MMKIMKTKITKKSLQGHLLYREKLTSLSAFPLGLYCGSVKGKENLF